MQGHYAPLKYLLAQTVMPGLMRDQLALQNASKVERGVRLQTALKANKVDIRHLLALPATDAAHPYKTEYPWEKLAIRADPRDMTFYGKWYHAKIFSVYEWLQYHRWGMYHDDLITAKGWWNRAARTRAPRTQVLHMDRRVYRGRSIRDKYLYDRKENWVAPVDNTGFFAAYCTMVSDEWEEKWGFFAGQSVEY